MANFVDIKPEMIRWAVDRSGLTLDAYPEEVESWIKRQAKPTLSKLEKFAKKARVPFGFLFLPEPPIETIPIPDFRTLKGKGPKRPSPDLLDTLYTMLRRQAWLCEDRQEGEAEPLEFVGSARVKDDPAAIGREMRRTVGLIDGWAASITTWQAAVGELRRMIEELDVIAVINGVVGNNTHRVLDVDEFRGFALSDPYAPLIFVNGADAKSAQMFTLAHELAHLWLGQSALTDTGIPNDPTIEAERWCDRAAAEFLVPEKELRTRWQQVRSAVTRFQIVARQFKVSPIMAARRAKDLGLIDRDEFFAFHESWTGQERTKGESAGGGDFYRNQNNRIGEAFARNVMLAAMGGRLSFKEAYSLTGLNGGAFQEYAERLGVKLP